MQPIVPPRPQLELGSTTQAETSSSSQSERKSPRRRRKRGNRSPRKSSAVNEIVATPESTPNPNHAKKKSPKRKSKQYQSKPTLSEVQYEEVEETKFEGHQHQAEGDAIDEPTMKTVQDCTAFSHLEVDELAACAVTVSNHCAQEASQTNCSVSNRENSYKQSQHSSTIESIETNSTKDKSWVVAEALSIELGKATTSLKQQTATIEQLQHSVRLLMLQHVIHKHIDRSKLEAFYCLKYNESNNVECALAEELVTVSEQLENHKFKLQSSREQEAQIVHQVKELNTQVSELVTKDLSRIGNAMQSELDIHSKLQSLSSEVETLSQDKLEMEQALKYKSRAAQQLCSRLMKLEEQYDSLLIERDDLLTIVDELRETQMSMSSPPPPPPACTSVADHSGSIECELDQPPTDGKDTPLGVLSARCRPANSFDDSDVVTQQRYPVDPSRSLILEVPESWEQYASHSD